MISFKRILCLVTVLLMVLCFAGCDGEEEDHPKPTEAFYVNDFAEVISDKDEEEMLSRAIALNEATTAQVVVTTVHSLNGEEPAMYATSLAKEWGIGDEEKDNGVLILLSESDREIFIAVGYGLEGRLPDSKTGRIIDTYGLEYLQDDDFSAGLLEISKAVVGEVYLEYGMTSPDGYTSTSLALAEEEAGNMTPMFISWGAFLAIFIILSIINRKRGRRFFFIGGPGSFGGGFSGGFGGFSGGGSFGGGGFSGGGGSFGGGGAGRGF